jgi:hypothetical protein
MSAPDNDAAVLKRDALNAAYRERNQVVAALAKCFPSGLKKTAISGWDSAWHNCVYIDLPTGQASWHFHDDDAELFAGLPPYIGEWDGHSTPEKYERLAKLSRATENEGGADLARKVVRDQAYLMLSGCADELAALAQKEDSV